MPGSARNVVAVAPPYDSEQIVGAAEIAQRLGVARGVVGDWRRRYDDFPEPVASLTMGHVWNWPDVERWARDTGRLP